MSCPFDGSTSVEIDETCYFSNSTTFGNAANSRSIRASGKMSVLICVAIYVFIVWEELIFKVIFWFFKKDFDFVVYVELRNRKGMHRE